MSGADGMCVDTNGTLYVATALGVQFCDQAGRVDKHDTDQHCSNGWHRIIQ